MTVNANEKNTALDMQEVIQLGKINPFRDENGKMLPESVSEITHMIIGGMSQGMIIRGRNSKNPVILYVHGGPGIPEYAFGSKFRILLEQECTICWWEERGAGISYHPKIPGETMTLNQMINDTIEVANYLRKRFDKEKIYLMGSSWGSLIGAYVASLRPDLFYAYIGISQVSNQFESVKTAYDYMLKISEKNGDRVSVSKLKKYRLNDPDSITAKYFLLHVNILNKLGIGITHTIKSVFKERVLPIFKTKEYNFLQKISFIRGMRFSQKYFLNILMKKYPMEDCKSFEIPVYFFEGIYDYLVSSALAERYFEMLSAPKKKLYKFNNSSHCPHFEEPEIFKKIFFEDILKEADS